MEGGGGDVWREDSVQEPHVLFDLLELSPD
jgi:hypothetical protein